METKQCTKCGEIKSLDKFSKSSKSVDGRQPKCRQDDNLILLLKTAQYLQENQ